jgi:hypothetical protein
LLATAVWLNLYFDWMTAIASKLPPTATASCRLFRLRRSRGGTASAAKRLAGSVTDSWACYRQQAGSHALRRALACGRELARDCSLAEPAFRLGDRNRQQAASHRDRVLPAISNPAQSKVERLQPRKGWRVQSPIRGPAIASKLAPTHFGAPWPVGGSLLATATFPGLHFDWITAIASELPPTETASCRLFRIRRSRSGTTSAAKRLRESTHSCRWLIVENRRSESEQP